MCHLERRPNVRVTRTTHSVRSKCYMDFLFVMSSSGCLIYVFFLQFVYFIGHLVQCLATLRHICDKNHTHTSKHRKNQRKHKPKMRRFPAIPIEWLAAFLIYMLLSVQIIFICLIVYKSARHKFFMYACGWSNVLQMKVRRKKWAFGIESEYVRMGPIAVNQKQRTPQIQWRHP